MPFYSYHCPDCQISWDEFRKVEDRNKNGICPFCKSMENYRDISKELSFFVFKGNGFYTTDYKKEK